MAQYPKDYKPFGFPTSFERNNAVPLDKSSVWYSLRLAAEYAANDPTAYVGQILTVIAKTNNTCSIYTIANTVGDLTAILTDASFEAITHSDIDNIIAES